MLQGVFKKFCCLVKNELFFRTTFFTILNKIYKEGTLCIFGKASEIFIKNQLLVKREVVIIFVSKGLEFMSQFNSLYIISNHFIFHTSEENTKRMFICRDLLDSLKLWFKTLEYLSMIVVIRVIFCEAQKFVKLFPDIVLSHELFILCNWNEITFNVIFPENDFKAFLLFRKVYTIEGSEIINKIIGGNGGRKMNIL